MPLFIFTGNFGQLPEISELITAPLAAINGVDVPEVDVDAFRSTNVAGRDDEIDLNMQRQTTGPSSLNIPDFDALRVTNMDNRPTDIDLDDNRTTSSAFPTDFVENLNQTIEENNFDNTTFTSDLNGDFLFI